MFVSVGFLFVNMVVLSRGFNCCEFYDFGTISEASILLVNFINCKTCLNC